MINTTFGILSNGLVTQDSQFYRFSDTRPTDKQLPYINKLFTGVQDVGASVDFLIKFLRSSEYWPDYVRKYDPVNTYDDCFFAKEASGSVLSYKGLSAWLDSNSVAGGYTVYRQDSFPDRLRATLFNLLTLK